LGRNLKLEYQAMSTPPLSELLAQKAALEQQIIDAQREQRAAAIAQVRALMSEYGLTLADLGSRPSAAPRKPGGVRVAPKFRNAATGETWSGRGLQPKWLRSALAGGAQLDDFRI
jgi:DNA-binding protein H-NS